MFQMLLFIFCIFLFWITVSFLWHLATVVWPFVLLGLVGFIVLRIILRVTR